MREKKPVSVGRMVPPPARTWSAAGRRKEDSVIGQGVHDVSAGGDLKLLGAVVDIDLYGTGRGEGGLDPEKERNKDKGHNNDDSY